MKKLIVFDLDGTLTPSKGTMDAVTLSLLCRLLRVKKIAVIGGGTYEQFKRQMLRAFACPPALLRNLFLFPTTATSFYRYRNGWKKVYAKHFSAVESKKVMRAFKETFRETGYVRPRKVYGKLIEDRGAQITFSALGQRAPVRVKERWSREEKQARPVLIRALKKRLPQFEVREAGLTSIDVTRRGVDKAYGLREIGRYLRVPIRDMLFVGDAIAPGWNDYGVVRTGVRYVKVRGPQGTRRVIRSLLETGV